MAEKTVEYDLVVIGGGPAGYAGAIRAGQLGQKVACVEMEQAGGTCLNWGCIPTKALLHSAQFYLKMQQADQFGFTVGDIAFDFAQVMDRSRRVAGQMAQGIEFLFKKNQVDYLPGQAEISAPGMVSIVAGEAKGTFLQTRNILIATGCQMRPLPNLAVDGQRVMTSREALAITKRPESLVIVGAGAIGVEFAYFFRAFGTAVTLVEMRPRVLPLEDHEVSRTLERSFTKLGMKIHTDTKCENFQVGAKSVKLDLRQGDAREEIEVEAVLSAIGVRANLAGVLASSVPVALDQDYVSVDDHYQTSVEGIYAAGDIIGPPWLAHVATFEAVNAVNGMFGHGRPVRVQHFPGCTYCQPQVASIGLTEQAAQERKIDYKVGKFPFTASGKAVAGAASDGFVKVIADAKTGEIHGAHIIGAEATELIAEYGLAMKLEATVEEIHQTIHAHPTLSEAVMEAAAAAMGEAIHV